MHSTWRRARESRGSQLGTDPAIPNRPPPRPDVDFPKRAMSASSRHDRSFNRTFHLPPLFTTTPPKHPSTMSFGRPGALGDSFKVTPPQRGSFPLDHEGESMCRSGCLPDCTRRAKPPVARSEAAPLAVRADPHRRLQARHDSVHELPEGERERRRVVPAREPRVPRVPDGQWAHDARRLPEPWAGRRAERERGREREHKRKRGRAA